MLGGEVKEQQHPAIIYCLDLTEPADRTDDESRRETILLSILGIFLFSNLEWSTPGLLVRPSVRLSARSA